MLPHKGRGALTGSTGRVSPASIRSTMTERSSGLVLVVGGILLVSTDSAITRAAEVGGWVVAFWYGVFAFPAMFTYYTVSALRPGGRVQQAEVNQSGRPSRFTARLWPHRPGFTVISAGLQAVSTTCFILAIKATAISSVVVIVAAVPAVTAVVAWTLLGERPSGRLWKSIGATAVGIVVVVSGSLQVGALTGNVLAMCAVLAFAFNLTLWRRHPAINRTLVIAIGAAFTSVVAATQIPLEGQSTRTYILMFLMGAVLGPLGRIGLASATRYLSAAEVGLVTPIETAAASLWGWLFFGELPPTATFAGGAIIVAAVLYGSLGSSASKG